MIHIVNEKQPYHSRLREEQMERTRERILEGLIKTMAHGITELSIPAVAREAGVSVPTIYRYFHNKRELVEALGGYFVQKLGIDTSQLPRSPEELADQLKVLANRNEGLDDEVLQMAATSQISYEMRKEGLPHRLKAIELALAPVADQFSEEDRVRLRNVVLILTSSATQRAFHDYLDMSNVEAADHIAWAILTLAHSQETRKQE